MVYVIAECGVNWRTLAEADQMIREAAQAGAQAVKFQAYDVVFDETMHPRFQELNNIRLTEDMIAFLYWRCIQHNVDFICTPMYPEAVFMLAPYVDKWKIRYDDRDNEAILALCEETGIEMLISGKNLFCISDYPPMMVPPKEILKEFIGVSSHFPCTQVVENWIQNNPHIKYLEVHVRLDDYGGNFSPIDTQVSLTMSELAHVCWNLRDVGSLVEYA